MATRGSDTLVQEARKNRRARGNAEPAELPRNGSNGHAAHANGHGVASRSANGKGKADAVKASSETPVPTEWDQLSLGGRAEVEHLLEVLKAVKQGNFAVRFAYHKDGVLGRAGE